jgi:adenylate cyclase
MNEPGSAQAWLERPDGERIAVVGNVSFGRTSDNTVVLPDERVSRRHALIHPQGTDGYWLVDLGSRNGTYVNERRVGQPRRLRDGDRLQLGPFTFVFRQAHAAPATRHAQVTTLQTLVDVRTLPCWLLVLDVQGSTDLARRLPAPELAVLLGRWFNACRQVIETHGGTINKYLGDGLLAYWPADKTDAPALAKMLEALRPLQAAGTPAFRLVLHHGLVTFGGAASLGEDSLSGPEVNFVFRMEKLAGQLGVPALFSAPAAAALATVLALTPRGEHPLPGFEGAYAFYGG